jgi:hypothetical protein
MNRLTTRRTFFRGATLGAGSALLAPFQDRLAIVQGLSGRICGGGHSNNFGAPGAHPSKAGAAGEMIDLALARALPAIFPHIGPGISGRPEHTVN